MPTDGVPGPWLMTAPTPVTRSTRKMSPSAREPKNAHGPAPMAMPSGRNPFGKANSVGKAADPLAAVARWSAAVEAAPAGMATTIAAITASITASAIVNRRRRYVMGSLPSPPGRVVSTAAYPLQYGPITGSDATAAPRRSEDLDGPASSRAVITD